MPVLSAREGHPRDGQAGVVTLERNDCVSQPASNRLLVVGVSLGVGHEPINAALDGVPRYARRGR